MGQEVREQIELAPCLQPAYHLGDRGWRRTCSAEIGRHPVVLGELAVPPSSPPLERLIETSARAVKTSDDRWRQRVHLMERIADSSTGGGILVEAGVAHQYPSRAGRITEEPDPAHRAEHLAHPPRTRQRGFHGLALGDVSQQSA